MYKLTKEQLLSDLYSAFKKAKKNKSKRSYVKKFESDLDNNLLSLCEDLWNKTYIPQASSCFIITKPKKREVFAAQFRDRIVHKDEKHIFYSLQSIKGVFSHFSSKKEMDFILSLYKKS